MSRSVKKRNFTSWHSSKSMKAWRTQENRRLRHNAKQIINVCDDYDVLIIPDIDDYDTLWGSPQDGKKHYWARPHYNQCEVDLERAKQRIYRWCEERPDLIPIRIKEEEKRYKHGGRNCDCYSNKSGWWWKNMRK